MSVRYVVFESGQRKECAEMRLVLVAAGMSADISAEADRWLLLVEEQAVDAAMAELAEYQKDKTDDTSVEATPPACRPGGAIEGIVGYALITIICASASWYSASAVQLMVVGESHAGSLLAGQWWRAVTALTLHQDFVHLFSNLIFGGIFGYLAGQLLGGGLAWILILTGGAAGNYFNALVRDSSHHSIGASTAVFAALGIVVALALRPSLGYKRSAMQRWSPLIAGVLLLAFLGTGGVRTDVSAHFTGFMAGLIGGWLSSHLPADWLCHTKLQWTAGLAAMGIVLLAWLVGLVAS